jgi:hypothetical protein
MTTVQSVIDRQFEEFQRRNDDLMECNNRMREWAQEAEKINAVLERELHLSIAIPLMASHKQNMKAMEARLKQTEDLLSNLACAIDNDFQKDGLFFQELRCQVRDLGIEASPDI